MNENKRRVSVFVPYKINSGSIFIFLQKRLETSTRGAGMFGFFGGGLRNSETPEEGLIRETKEELGIVPQQFHFYKEYDLPAIGDLPPTLLYLFVGEVDDLFESKIKTEDGLGKWFGKEDYLSNKKIIIGELSILDELYSTLK